MIYTALTKKAMKISFEAHKDQVDKCGIPYVYHPFHIAEQMTDEITTCVALLHDVIEDTNTTIDDLRNDGFPDEVLEALELLTHKDNESYFDYVNRIKDNPVLKIILLQKQLNLLISLIIWTYPDLMIREQKNMIVRENMREQLCCLKAGPVSTALKQLKVRLYLAVV